MVAKTPKPVLERFTDCPMEFILAPYVERPSPGLCNNESSAWKCQEFL